MRIASCYSHSLRERCWTEQSARENRSASLLLLLPFAIGPLSFVLRPLSFSFALRSSPQPHFTTADRRKQQFFRPRISENAIPAASPSRRTERDLFGVFRVFRGRKQAPLFFLRSFQYLRGRSPPTKASMTSMMENHHSPSCRAFLMRLPSKTASWDVSSALVFSSSSCPSCLPAPHRLRPPPLARHAFVNRRLVLHALHPTVSRGIFIADVRGIAQ